MEQNLSATLVNWVLSAFALIVTSFLVPGFRLNGFVSALLAAIVVGFLNAILRPILIFLTLPINILTLGLFTFVVNAIILKIAAAIIKGFEISSWWAAVLGAVMLALINMLILAIF